MFSGDDIDVLDSEPLESVHRSDDVDDRIEGADFVEMNPLDGGVVDRRFGLGQPLEHVHRAILSFARQRGTADRRDDVFEMVVRVVTGRRGIRRRLFDETELRCRHAGPQDAIGRDVAVFDRQAAKRTLQGFHRQAEIDQRAQDHVPRCARETV